MTRALHWTLFLSVLAFSAGCATGPTSAPPGTVQGMGQNEYTALILRNTSKTDRYSGFYQTFQAEMTILTAEVQTATLQQKAHFLQWDQTQFQAERDKTVQEAAAYSKFFMRFYSPEPDYADLHKGKTIWRVYLDYNGSRFEGKVRKMTEKFVELQSIYPYFDRFSTPYEITFNVPMTSVEKSKAKVILTSSLGSAEFSFPTGK